MAFTVTVRNGEAEFWEPEEHEFLTKQVYDACDEYDAGRLTTRQLVERLRDLIAKEPDLMAAYAAVGEALLEEGRDREACSALEKGFTRGEAALPVDFKGEIRWVCHRNRPFLRTAHVLSLCYRNAGERKKAIKTMEKILGWNPSDNQGIRWLIGSEYMRAGQRSRAESTFREHGSEYPPYRYELGLLYFQEGEHARAATSLRHGFIENPYIAEILCGTPAPMRLTIWEGSNLQEVECAQAYVASYGELWHETAHALQFLRWVHTHPKVMMERAEILACKEALLWSADIGERRRILLDEQEARNRIDDQLSATIVRERTDSRGRTTAPWRAME